MKLTKHDTTTSIELTPTEMDLIASALRALNLKHVAEKTMTNALKSSIVQMLIPIEYRITSLEEVIPELSQELYDEFLELEKLNILQSNH